MRLPTPSQQIRIRNKLDDSLLLLARRRSSRIASSPICPTAWRPARVSHLGAATIPHPAVLQHRSRAARWGPPEAAPTVRRPPEPRGTTDSARHLRPLIARSVSLVAHDAMIQCLTLSMPCFALPWPACRPSFVPPNELNPPANLAIRDAMPWTRAPPAERRTS